MMSDRAARMVASRSVEGANTFPTAITVPFREPKSDGLFTTAAAGERHRQDPDRRWDCEHFPTSVGSSADLDYRRTKFLANIAVWAGTLVAGQTHGRADSFQRSMCIGRGGRTCESKM
jgi:hypothetical protein